MISAAHLRCVLVVGSCWLHSFGKSLPSTTLCGTVLQRRTSVECSFAMRHTTAGGGDGAVTKLSVQCTLCGCAHMAAHTGTHIPSVVVRLTSARRAPDRTTGRVVY